MPDVKHLVNRALGATGLRVVRAPAAEPAPAPPQDFDSRILATIAAVRPYTMTSDERIASLILAVRHVVAAGLPGEMAECGVWRGGSMMTVARTLLEEGDTSRRLYLFDTFQGMVEPTAADTRNDGTPAMDRYLAARTEDGGSDWCRADIDTVRAAVASTGYPMDQVELVEGPVEETLPGRAPEQLALLRLDTDWYESTRHELEVLFHRVTRHGIVIIDDYGSWAGARKAVDEFVAKLDTPVYLNRVDPTGRLIVVP